MNCNPSVQISFASNSSLDISREELRYLVRRVEAALLRSKPYRKVLSDLDAMPQKTAQHARLHTSEAVKDAIRLTLKEILTYYKVASLPTSDTSFEEELVQTATPKAMPAAIAPKLPDPALPSNAVTVPARYCHRASQGKQAEQLRAIGTQLAEARRELGLTAYDLY
ncbi:MAG: hypothetical protein HC925_06175, partial [Coleofasciculaceae cyanobacterium SM2_3_26]|nr:hypothetical protein [Coleofasciculaceae cyanobacterium SM2_3_26]